MFKWIIRTNRYGWPDPKYRTDLVLMMSLRKNKNLPWLEYPNVCPMHWSLWRGGAVGWFGCFNLVSSTHSNLAYNPHKSRFYL